MIQTVETYLQGKKPPTPRKHHGTKGMSVQMWDTLAWIYSQHVAGEGRDVVPWRHDGRGTPSQRASASRTLKRLAERGLVKRFNFAGDGQRTTEVQITREGCEAIKQGLTRGVLTAAGPSGA